MAAGQRLAGALNALSTPAVGDLEPRPKRSTPAAPAPGGEVAEIAKQIAQLNEQIKLAEQANQPPNDMLDRRDLLIDKLSSLAQVTVTANADGTDTIAFGDAAKPLVEGSTVNWPQTLTAAAGGELGGLLALTGEGGSLTGFRTRTRRCRRHDRLERQRPAHRDALLQPATPPRRSLSPSKASRSPELLDRSGWAATTSRWRSPGCAAAPPIRATPRWSRRSATRSSRPRANRPTCRPR